MWVLRFHHEGKKVAAPLLGPVVKVGNAEGNDVRLKVAGISRRHCEFFLKGESPTELWVRDLGSLLGVKRGDESLSEAPLREGDCLALGPVWVFVEKESTLDWKGRTRAPSPVRLALGADAGGGAGDTHAPEREFVPLDLLSGCLEALAEGGDWGRRWIRLLGLDALSVERDGEGGRLCLLPAPDGPLDGGSDASYQGRAGTWSASWKGGNRESRLVLRALLPVLDIHRQTEPGGSSPQQTKPRKTGRITALEGVWEPLEPLAATDLPIVILGETGVGKEVLARAIHATCFPKGAPFEVIHCAAIPEPLFESELFGIEPNTASGVSGKRGKLEAASGGTVLLDEVGEIPLLSQAKLLRVLEDRTILPVGGRQAKALKVRWLAATNQHLQKAIAEGRFREDLYFRLRGSEVTIPPLRERLQGLSELVDSFLEELEGESSKGLQGLSVDAYRCLMAHRWPGNIRELKMEIRRAYSLADPGGLIQCRHLSPGLRGRAGDASAVEPDSLAGRRMASEAQTLREALGVASGNVTRAAEKLGITRQTLTRKLNELGIDADSFRPGKRG